MLKKLKVLYTRHKTQKSKVWHDGMVTIFDTNGIYKVSLYKCTEDCHKGDLIEAYNSRQSLDNIMGSLNFQGYLVELNDENCQYHRNISNFDVLVGVDKVVDRSASAINHSSKHGNLHRTLLTKFKCPNITSKVDKSKNKDLESNAISNNSNLVKRDIRKIQTNVFRELVGYKQYLKTLSIMNMDVFKE
ncbi:uncharacterized protein CMU_036090 [Cryptosporidium muris RN66]|uniref:5'-3' DNA helicase ZGRF1-like N-terminal domain-containing protein n=1 Tax=Cryptosporidium muris (strain RN66) TaxID=441375 RepID=B6AGU5_CRYMR|nr:uncharacterized protein CMU_036090 [Cryptosporidium muris RN66]EEA07436.1 hypothetical protein, conserved [Cryptosporidium muris RN66]|eukprot:XP_002141785.1 hypothetical protein [Cryptosporidium muris RN66]